MTFGVTRRDAMKFAGGAAIGIALSPAPWRLLDDLAIWTQNGSWIPRLPRGPVTEHLTTCALCPAACPMKARCVSGVPVQLSAVADVPLCPLGLTGHHLAYHPARLTSAARIFSGDRSRLVIDSLPLPIALADLALAFSTAGARGTDVVVLDGRPDRSVSHAWRQLLGSFPDGVYVPCPTREGASLASALSGAVGIDLEGVRTVLSFGVPLAEGWGSPRTLRLFVENRVELIQVEPIRSRTAAKASLWIPVRPGAEGLVARAIRSEIRRAGGTRREEDGDFAGLAVEPEAAARVAGISPSLVAKAAEMLVTGVPSLAIAGVDPGGGRLDSSTEAAITALNVELESIGALGGLVMRTELPSPLDDGPLAPERELDQLPDSSVGVLVIDSSAGDAAISWPALRQKLASGARVVALTPFLSGTARHADLVFPSPAFLEAVGELPTPVDSLCARYALSAPLLPSRKSSIDPGMLIRMLAERTGVPLSGSWRTSEDLMRARVARIHATGRGRIVWPEGPAAPVSEIGSADRLWSTLMSGSWWEDELLEVGRFQWNVPDEPAASGATVCQPLTLVVRGPRDAASSAVASPVMTKLYRETKLRRDADVVVMHPETAREQGVRRDANALLVTEAGRIRVKVETERSVRPGLAIATIAPSALSLGLSRDARSEILDICPADGHGRWRVCPARLEV